MNGNLLEFWVSQLVEFDPLEIDIIWLKNKFCLYEDGLILFIKYQSIDRCNYDKLKSLCFIQNWFLIYYCILSLGKHP